MATQVRRLVVQLGDPHRSRRDHASEQLEALGVDVLPLLEVPLALARGEAAWRLQTLRSRLAERAVAEAIEPTRVVAAPLGMTLPEAFEAVFISRGGRLPVDETAGAGAVVGALADCGTSLPPQDAATGDPQKPRLFGASPEWKKAMDGFFHGQLAARLQGGVDLPLRGVGLELLPLVMRLAAPPHTKEQFGPSAREVHLERHERQPFVEGVAGKLGDLTAMQEEFSPSLGHMVELIGLFVFGNVAAHEPDLSLVDAAVGLVERNPSRSQAFHLAADQSNPAFERLENLILVTRLAVLRDDAF
jgi:hypothetical protein